MKIIKKKRIEKGIIYTVKVRRERIKILFLNHAIERMREWNLSEEKVLTTLLFPEEVLLGHNNRFIAHKRYVRHLVRCVYEYREELITLVTVYFPYKERYFQGGGIYEDKILP